MANRLKNEKSPYLLQHADNPVDWFPWCEEAFQKAEDEDKPVFLSIGYSTCHWCHVMAHESFEDREVAEILNRDFVSIKVDREERPDIDSVYMSVCQAVTGSGGWPLTIIMTPKQKPFFAGTYFPKKRRFGQAGLMEILQGVTQLWKQERKSLLRDSEQITEALRRKDHFTGKEPEKEILQRAYQIFCTRYDFEWGGFGNAPKFPTPHNLLFLMKYSLLENAPEAWQMAEETLEAMARGGIHDHIGGGFSRYSTDEKWLIPHFEKMLYDNALLLMAYLKAGQITKEERYMRIARSTADYILRELTDGQGGFYCGQDADSDGVEGKYYVFTPEEIKAVLGEKDGREFCHLYGITESGNFEGKNVPNCIRQPAWGWRNDDIRLKKMYEYRRRRTKLYRDEKILLSWNSWAILALARAGEILGDDRYLQAALRAQRFIEENMTDKHNRLYLRFCGNEAAHLGQLEDYAVYALALLELYRITFRTEYLAGAVFRAQQMTELFSDRENGGYYITPADARPLIFRPKETYDGAMPSGNSAAAMVLQKLSVLTGETRWQEASERQMMFCAEEAGKYPAGYGFFLLAMADALYPHKELVCTVKGEVPEKLKRYLKEYTGDDLTVLIKTAENAEELSKYAPFTRNYPLPREGAVFYLCENGVCREPFSDVDVLKSIWNLE